MTNVPTSTCMSYHIAKYQSRSFKQSSLIIFSAVSQSVTSQIWSLATWSEYPQHSARVPKFRQQSRWYSDTSPQTHRCYTNVYFPVCIAMQHPNLVSGTAIEHQHLTQRNGTIPVVAIVDHRSTHIEDAVSCVFALKRYSQFQPGAIHFVPRKYLKAIIYQSLIGLVY